MGKSGTETFEETKKENIKFCKPPRTWGQSEQHSFKAYKGFTETTSCAACTCVSVCNNLGRLYKCRLSTAKKVD